VEPRARPLEEDHPVEARLAVDRREDPGEAS